MEESTRTQHRRKLVCSLDIFVRQFPYPLLVEILAMGHLLVLVAPRHDRAICDVARTRICFGHLPVFFHKKRSAWIHVQRHHPPVECGCDADSAASPLYRPLFSLMSRMAESYTACNLQEATCRWKKTGSISGTGWLWNIISKAHHLSAACK